MREMVRKGVLSRLSSMSEGPVVKGVRQVGGIARAACLEVRE